MSKIETTPEALRRLAAKVSPGNEVYACDIRTLTHVAQTLDATADRISELEQSIVEDFHPGLATAEAERDELRATFDMRWKADQRAIARWQAAAPEGEDRSKTWPDHADMVVWLLERLDEAEARAALAEPSDG